MLIFNSTFSVNRQIHEHWLKWMKANFVPKTHENELIKGCKILKLLTEFENDDVNYSVQLFFDEMEEYVSFELHHKEILFERHEVLFRGKFLMFSTLLEEV